MRIHTQLYTTTLSAAILSTVLAALLCTTPAQAQTSGCVTVEVQNVRPQQGHLMVAAYGDAESFNKKPLASQRVAAGEAVTRFQLCGLQGSEVALTMFQDLDSDGKMGQNVLGMPSEPWGSSGKPGMFGPTWDTGKVALDGSVIVVRLSQ
jgi:uncharacterized protein (DUF2141 family)